MDFEISQEKAQELGLSEEQVKGVTTYGAELLKAEHGKWEEDLKTNGNKFANGLADGMAASIHKLTGVARNEAEKVADYLGRAGNTWLADKNQSLEDKTKEYDDKLKNFKGAEAIQTELSTLKGTHEDMLKKYANYDELKAAADKLPEVEKEYTALKVKTAFNTVKPNFPSELNTFERDAKWNAFMTRTLEKYNIEINAEGKAVAVDKENAFTTFPLESLVAKDEEIQAIAKGRQQDPLNVDSKEKVTVEGVPFKVPIKGTSADMQKAITEYLQSKGIDKLHKEYSPKFSEYWTRIRTEIAKS